MLDEDANGLFSSRSTFEALLLNPYPVVARLTSLTLAAISLFAEHCRDIAALVLYIDITTDPPHSDALAYLLQKPCEIEIGSQRYQ